MDIAKELERMDNLQVLRADCCQAAIHDRHRWTLAMIYRAQEMNLVNRPCALVSFDSHADSLEPIAAVRIDELCRNGFDGKDVVSLCSDDLSTNNDDWIRAAMRLGLVSDAVVFGLHDKLERVQFDDRHGNKHRLWTCTMPGSALDWQGVLRDHFKRDELGAQPIWDILDWHNDLGTLGFRGSEDKLFLTIDLDCFRIKWREYTIPWPDEIYEVEFNKYCSGCDWSGGDFCDRIILRAGYLDIAREPGCCGGPEKSRMIFHDMNKYMFKNSLVMEGESV